MPTNADLVLHLFLQLAVIVGACRLGGWLLRPLGQTQVVSEMIIGVLLGPSVFGLLLSTMQGFLFPTTLTLAEGTTITHPAMSILYALSQLGLVLYMFLIGLQLDTALITRHFKHAASISGSGIAAPMLFGGAIGFALAGDDRLFVGDIGPWQAALFLASALSITAFPMLARIIYERGIAGTRIGTLALGAAACDDAAAWSLLAIVLAVTKDSAIIALLAIGGGAAYAAVILLVGRPLFRALDRLSGRDARRAREAFALLLLVLMLCSWFTDATGIYAIFGAFLAGAAMPRGRLADDARRAIEPLTVALLLPIFFLYSGLNTRLDLLIQPSLLGITVLLMVAAFACKGLACGAATRLAGTSWREATAIGVLMNARGLMELILINIGLDRGLISPALYSILMLVAIVTTVAASPLFQLVWRTPVAPAVPITVAGIADWAGGVMDSRSPDARAMPRDG